MVLLAARNAVLVMIVFCGGEPRAGCAQAKSSTAWVQSSLKRVMPDMLPTAHHDEESRHESAHLQATVQLAGNEHESFQIALRPQINCTYAISWTDLDPVTLSWEQVGLVYAYDMMQNEDGPEGPGWWPDPTLRVPKAFGVQNVTTSIWFTLHAPYKSAAGVYTSTITLEPTVPTDGDTIQVKLSVTVFGFSLPIMPALQTAFNLQESSLASVYNPGAALHKKWNISVIRTMWLKTGCNNPFSETKG